MAQMLERYVYKNQKKMRCGYTTGTCASAAAKAAAQMLLSGRKVTEVSVRTPSDITLTLPVCEIQMKAHAVSCAVQKDSGDDPDITNKILIFAEVSYIYNSSNIVNDTAAVKPQIIVDGGVGIGRITKKGLARPVGAAAINPVPLKMIEAALKETAEAFGYEGGLQAVISAPQGVEIAKKTFNPQLGITGGISILGTSGIVEPMSEQALIDTIRTEMKMHLADGEQTLLITPGNYGQDFLHETLKIELKRSIKCSNFIGDTIDMGCELGAKGMLFVGHIGKLVKLGAGIMNTHSKMADGRMEILAACAVRAGAGIEAVRNILDCVTTDAALELLKNEKILGKTMEQLMLRIDACLQKRGGDNMQIGAVVFSNEYGLLGKTEQADELLLKITADVSSEK
jgi:cobalt-precorrin-5B (C1)-methyltransferase